LLRSISVTSNGCRASALAADKPPKPPPTMTTRGAGSIRASFMVRSVPFHRHCYSRGFAEQGSIAYVLHTQRL
jgi:hypothetical protein